jgi:hypothetical protein
MIKQVFVALVINFSLLSSSSLAVTVTPISATVSATAVSRVTGLSNASVTNIDGFNSAPRTIITSATAISQINPLNFIESTTSTFAAFNSSSNAFILIGQNRRIGSGVIGNSNITANVSIFTYNFLTDINSNLNINYTVNTNASNPFGLGSHIIINLNRSDIIRQNNVFNPNVTGFLSIPLLANTPYSLIFDNSGNIGGGLGESFNGSVFSRFDFSITGVGIPEPSSWITLIIGFFFIGFAVRRQHQQHRQHRLNIFRLRGKLNRRFFG